MKPRVIIPDDALPPLKAAVTLDYRPPDRLLDTYTRFTTRVVARDEDGDWLDALRAPSGSIAIPQRGHEAWMLWGSRSVLYRYRVQIEEITDPIPAVRIIYCEPPVKLNRRQQLRSYVNITGRFALIPEENSVSEENPLRYWRTMTRDVSYWSIRFYVPDSLPSNARLLTEWNLTENSPVFTASMRLLRTRPELSVYRSIPGYNVVAYWDPPLTDEPWDTWRNFCDIHRYD